MKEKIAKGVVWLGAAKLIINLIAFCSTLLLAHLLTPEDFGLVALATTMLAVISAFTELSMASALIHHHEPTDAHFHTAWTLNFSRALIVAVLFSMAAPFVAQAYNEPRLQEIMYALSVSTIFVGLNNPKLALLTRNLVFKQDFILTVLQKISGFVISIAIAFFYQSYWALILGAMASHLVGVIASYVILPYRPKLALIHARELWSFSIWLTLGQIVNTLNWKFDHLLIGSFLGPSTLGQYTVGDNLAGMATREAIGPLETTLFPGFARIAKDSDRLKAAYSSVQSLLSAVALPVGIGSALIAQPLVLVGMGEKWLPAVAVIQVLSCIFALQTLSSPVHPLAMAKGQTKLLFHRDLLSLIIRVPIIVAGMILGGLPGIIYGRAVTGAISIIINMHLVRRLIGTKIREQIFISGRSLVAVVFMAIGVTVFKYGFDSWGVSLGYEAKDTFFLISKIGATILVGASSYVTGHYVLWRLMKRPQGPETEVVNALKKVAAKLHMMNASK